MKKALIFLAEGFEEVEALSVLDALKRGGVEVTTAAVGEDKAVKGYDRGRCESVGSEGQRF